MEAMLESLNVPVQTGGANVERTETTNQLNSGFDGLLQSLAIAEEPVAKSIDNVIAAPVAPVAQVSSAGISADSAEVTIDEATTQTGGGNSELENSVKEFVIRKQGQDDKYLDESNIRKLIQKYLAKYA
jgi:hypothetical protein